VTRATLAIATLAALAIAAALYLGASTGRWRYLVTGMVLGTATTAISGGRDP
jgi:hypothetical protein